MTDLILHHYPPSPVSEKVRIVFGIKGLAWRSVEIPRLPPRPLLFPMTGGYRRTPVLQVGADIYCDSALILDELERRHPEPSLYPEGRRGVALGLARWLDGPMFETAVGIVLGAAVSLPPDFARDRVSLYFGPDATVDDLASALARYLGQMDAQLAWLDGAMDPGDDFFCGAAPGRRDAQVWYLCWFLAGRYTGGRELIDAHPRLAAWYPRMEALGHGREQAMTGEDALALCASARPAEVVAVRHQGRGPDPEVEGELAWLDRTRVSLRRRDDQAGEVVVHFPRVGYQIRRL